MISVFNNSDTLSEAFSLTVFRTSGYTSECFTIALAAACKFDHIIFICLTKHLVLSWCGVLMRTFPELVLRTTFTWRPFLGRLLYLCVANGQDYHDFLFQSFFLLTKH